MDKHKFFYQGILGIFSAIFLTACGDSTHYAPVVEINTIEKIPASGKYVVQANETIYEIAWRYGLDYRYLVKINRLPFPYKLQEKQILLLKTAEVQQKKITLVNENELMQQLQNELASQSQAPVRIVPAQSLQFIWPTKGRVIQGFSKWNKGVNIAGSLHDPIFATAAGKVVYCGGGLPSYGNLIILKHNNEYLSAYAYNNKMFVKEGEWVRQGQKISEMGLGPQTTQPILHFEIRKAGAPLNPLSVLRK